MQTVTVKHIFVNECCVTCPTCGHVNFHTIDPPGAPIDKRPWGHRLCDTPLHRIECPGYNIVPAEDVKIHATLASFKGAGGMPNGWQAINMNLWREAR